MTVKALIVPRRSDRVLAYNGSGRTPAAAEFAWYEQQKIRTIERYSPHAVTIPDAVDAWTQLVADHGRMSLTEILAPAIDLARKGYAITPRGTADLACHQQFLAN